MGWITKATEVPQRAHVLDGDLFGVMPRTWKSLCGLELEPEGDSPNDLPRCSRCEERWTKAHPRKGGNRHARLPRHKCPDCGESHIDRSAKGVAAA